VEKGRSRSRGGSGFGCLREDLRLGPNAISYRVAFRRKIYSGIEQLQADLDAWLREYNELRPHQGRWCYGKTPMQTFRDSVPLAKEKMLGPTTASAAAEGLGL
jgi:hypothetical protein